MNKVINDVFKAVKQNAPEILTGIGIGGWFTTTVLAVRSTPKAIIAIENEKAEKDVDKLTAKDTIRVTWKYYIPSVVTGIASTACLIGASAENSRRNAALAAAYELSESALKTYKEKVVETIGQKKEEAIRTEIARDKVTEKPPVNKEVIITNKGETLCMDSVSGRYFKIDIDKLKRIEIDLAKDLNCNMYVTLNEYYYAIGIPGIKIGNDIGWTPDRPLELSLHSALAEDDRPCLVVDFMCGPVPLTQVYH